MVLAKMPLVGGGYRRTTDSWRALHGMEAGLHKKWKGLCQTLINMGVLLGEIDGPGG